MAGRNITIIPTSYIIRITPSSAMEIWYRLCNGIWTLGMTPWTKKPCARAMNDNETTNARGLHIHCSHFGANLKRTTRLDPLQRCPNIKPYLLSPTVLSFHFSFQKGHIPIESHTRGVIGEIASSRRVR